MTIQASLAWKWTLSCAVCLMGCAGAKDLFAEPAISLKAVADAWEARESRTRSFRFFVRRSKTFPPGALLNPDLGDQKNPNRLTIPPKGDHVRDVVHDGG